MTSLRNLSTSDLHAASAVVSSLLESKRVSALGGGPGDRNRLLNVVHSFDSRGTFHYRQNDELYARQRAAGLETAFYTAALYVIRKYQSKGISYSRAQQQLRELLRKYTADAYKYGLESTGVAQFLSRDKLHSADERWLKYATRREMIFLNNFLDDIKRGKYGSVDQSGAAITHKGLARRLSMYADTLFSAYLVGRVMSHPDNTLIWWQDRHDNRECDGCILLRRYSPFTKVSLPVTPRSGDTACRSNCRCKLVFQVVDRKVFQAAQAKQLTSRTILRMLRR